MSTSYLSQLLALQPPGRALPSSPESIWARLLAVPADSLERVENRTGDLVRESDPRDAIELLSDWECVCGLPGKCARPDTLNTVQARRAAVVNVLTRMGGQTMAWYIQLASMLGLEITIEEYRPFIAGLSRCGECLNGAANVRFVWHVTVKGKRLTWFRCGASACGDRLLTIAPADELECLLRAYAPAHTAIVIGYE